MNYPQHPKKLFQLCKIRAHPPESCSNCAKLEQELATYKGECFPYMLSVKKIILDFSNG